MAKKSAPGALGVGIKDDILEKVATIISETGLAPSDIPEPDMDSDTESHSEELDDVSSYSLTEDDFDYSEIGEMDVAEVLTVTSDTGSLDPDSDADEKDDSDDADTFDFSSFEESAPAVSFSAPEPITPSRVEAKSDDDIPRADHKEIIHDAEKHVGRSSEDVIAGGDSSDVIKAKKGDDEVSGGGSDDWLRGGHGDDVLDGGTGSDIVDGGKGDDTLKFTMGENGDNLDFYDGGKGSDTLEISLTAEEYEEYADELEALSNWVAENADSKNSTGHGFGDVSSHSAKHPIHETSFGLVVRNIEDVKITIIDGDPEPEVAPESVPDIVPAPEPPEEEVAESIVVDMETDVVEPGTVTTSSSTDSAISVDAISATLVAGSQIHVSVDVEVKELPPQFDVFLVQDLSGSFWDDLPNVKEQFPALHESLSAEYDVAFGVGSFIDKPIGTFGGSTDYVYKTDLAITTDGAAVAEVMNGLTASGGYDWPEAQLEALAQSALRSDEVGFRDGSQKFVIINTDAAFHKAGDYSGAVANDMDTNLEDEDYPDPMAVGALLQEAGITPIFAVTSYVVPIYEQLVADWGFGEVVTISSDSSDLSNSIMSGINSAVQSLSVDVVGDDFGYVSNITPDSYEDAGPGTYTFDLTLEIPEGDGDFSADSFEIEIAGYGKVNVEIDIASVDAVGDNNDDSLAGNSEDNRLSGMDGNDTLDGRDGNDTLEGGLGADLLIGGAGNDLFVFSDGDGADQITDFSTGDILDLRRIASVNSYSDVMIVAQQVGDDTVIDFGDGNSISLLSVEMASLQEDSMLF